ncbi:unnamed protein product [Oppiella nova]|uniref:Plasmodium RESA N-terminal domain-containing protein n=1 Tax=Oppiella nova TaxID=334625 RepID=A0A7R9MDW8_9ACAR|nr:unnamed protein product [Oppiella nova]CAG2175577.1 unnamed protein product [Oppiella nova]
MKANNLLKFIFILPTIVLLSVSSAANSIETTDGIEVEGDITERTTESEVEFITKTVVEEKVFTNKSQEDNEETTTHETVDYEVNEVNRGLVDNLLKGPTDEELPKNSSSERVYNYLWKLLSDEMRKEVDKYMPQMHEYIFVMNELVSQKCFLSLMRLANRGQKGEPRALKILKIV